jgi:hypothetical protein
MSAKLYTGISFWNFIGSVFSRIVLLFAAFYSLLHFDENPWFTVVLSGLCVTGITVIGNEVIEVYTDKIVQTSNSFFSLIFRSKGLVFKTREIKRAYREILPKSTGSEIGVAVFFSFLMPDRSRNNPLTNQIYFELNNGEVVKLETNLGDKQIDRIIELVNAVKR